MKTKPKISIALILITTLFSINLFAQRTTDIENGKDHPLVSRFDGAIIEFYKETKWGTYKLPLNDKNAIDWENPMSLEGKVTRIQYSTSSENNAEFVLHNYKSALSKAGYKILIAIANEELGVSDRPHSWSDKYYRSGLYGNDGLHNDKFGIGLNFPIWKNNHSFIVAKGNKEGKNIYVIVYSVVDNYTLITQDVIEIEAVETGMVSAENISKGIQTEGYFAVYDIFFDVGKSEVKPESADALKTIAEYLNTNKTQKVLIVGHTDNTGNFDMNISLSKDRANAVMEKLVSEYAVAREQLKPYGVGSVSPVASNSTEEGKAKNRRVEIVEQ
ncbi:MAG: OmpA family protein [Bacteroidales bacterium]